MIVVAAHGSESVMRELQDARLCLHSLLPILLVCLVVLTRRIYRLNTMKGVLLLGVGTLCGFGLARNMAPAPHGLHLQPRDVDPEDLYPAHNISVPVDHFHNDSKYEPHSNDYFNLRYFFDATYYEPGGPVIVLQSGEADATERLPFLQKGIAAILASATNGIGVVLEHRYYGTSFPTPDLSTDNLRFLSTEQALADQAYFASHVVFPGLEHLNLTAPGTPYIAYGGSYAGGLVAFLRVLYPDLTWGSISSSGVTEAIYDYWQYYEPIRQYGPPECIATQEKLINVVDNILTHNDSTTVTELKTGFGLGNLTYSDDFANVVSGGPSLWQSRNWDPAVGSPDFDYYCGNISSDAVLWPAYSDLASNASALIKAGGWGNESTTLTNRLLNFMGWINDSYVGSCDTTLDQCYSAHNSSASMYTDKNVSNYNSLSWAYQYCTEWGYIQTGSGVPSDRLPLISRLLTLDYLTLVCRYAFNITSPPDTEKINQWGGFNISYQRLALVGGEADPWRPATPLTTLDVPDRLNDTSTVSEPIILIEGAVHHWEENGVFANQTTPDLPPPPVANAQKELAQIVQEWLLEWKHRR
ncbi:putative extracellular serine carboxypeptidase [Exophiala dermatitidis]|uniref:Extracelular serine carboxypeptidase n=2 Tax=Exophiala dermatitidis TaxID=5970 RepID=H6BX37_EXODN|nr:extracelular serine carboxypeptidase [Exophiala dermatitidis NIH/UT8656]EHY55323.1 extracelular serine carboxypeptidase [Exophiala dermatitidis NIH/UT8656]